MQWMVFFLPQFISFFQVERFLNLPDKFKSDQFYFDKQRGFFCISKPQHCMTKSKGRPHPDIGLNVTLALRNFFKPYNNFFFQLAEQKFDWP